jgi:hypothetical protein
MTEAEIETERRNSLAQKGDSAIAQKLLTLTLVLVVLVIVGVMQAAATYSATLRP